VAVPILDMEVKNMLRNVIDIQLSGNTKARILDKELSNQYKKPKPNEQKIRAQEDLYEFLSTLK
jgi:polyphosphate kinase